FIENRGRNILMVGGDPDVAISFLNKIAVSPVKEEDMPYTAAGNIENQANQNILAFLDGRTSDSFNKANISLNDVANLGQLSMNDTENIIGVKKQIMEHGAVYFRYENVLSGYNSDKTSFYSQNNGSPHAALLVGWDDNYPASNFISNPGINGAWLVRTSRWENEDNETVKIGDDEYGCFWMSYAQAGGTGAGMTEVRSFSVREEKESVIENGSSVHTKDITSAWGARIFQSSRNERLIRVSFHTTDNNVKYQLFVNKFGKKIPTDPGRAENPLSEGEIAYAGYHTITLNDPVDLYEGDYYAVIVKMTMLASSNYRYPIAVEASMDKYLEVSVNEGESFFAEGDEVPSVWQDGASLSEGPYNACIMTFTEARATYDTEPSITTASLPSATINEYYTFALSSSGTQKIEWRSGNIPENFALSREGVLTGNPTQVGQYDITLTALNDVGYVEKTLALTVKGSSNTDQPSEQSNEPSGNTPSDNTPPEDEPKDTEITGVSGSGGGCNSLACFWGITLSATLFLRRKRG
ncbi:MAG: hypothetical protein IJ587_02260, partial [Synergistaceae bacterium]|nr:hypothetical protein [Synergistaceae bacterium]